MAPIQPRHELLFDCIPENTDIVIGGAPQYERQKGNITFADICNEFKQEYSKSDSSRGKKKIVEEIYDRVLDENMRFLTPDRFGVSNCMEKVSEQVALIHIRQHLDCINDNTVYDKINDGNTSGSDAGVDDDVLNNSDNDDGSHDDDDDDDDNENDDNGKDYDHDHGDVHDNGNDAGAKSETGNEAFDGTVNTDYEMEDENNNVERKRRYPGGNDDNENDDNGKDYDHDHGDVHDNGNDAGAKSETGNEAIDGTVNTDYEMEDENNNVERKRRYPGGNNRNRNKNKNRGRKRQKKGR